MVKNGEWWDNFVFHENGNRGGDNWVWGDMNLLIIERVGGMNDVWKGCVREKMGNIAV